MTLYVNLTSYGGPLMSFKLTGACSFVDTLAWIIYKQKRTVDEFTHAFSFKKIQGGPKMARAA